MDLTLSSKEQRFFDLCTVNGLTIETAYEQVWKPKDRKSTVTLISQKRKAKPELFELIESYKKNELEQIRTERIQARIEIAKDSVLTETEIDAQLSKVISGEFLNERKIPVWNRVKKEFDVIAVKERPSASEIVNAADKLYKRFGSYAPIEIDDVSEYEVIVPTTE